MSADAKPGRAVTAANNNVVRLPHLTRQYVERLFLRATQRCEMFLRVEPRMKAAIPLMATKVQAGFPSPADDYLDRPLCMNELLLRNPPATYMAWVDGDSMIGAGIFPGDLVLVDRSMPIKDRVIIMARVNLDFTLKRFRRRGSRIWLEAENPAYSDIDIKEGMSFEVWGGIRHSIRMLAPR